MRAHEFLKEHENVVSTKFMQRLGQKKGMYYNPDLEPPVSIKDGKPFDRFELQTTSGGRVANIIGIRGDYQEVVTTTETEIAKVMVQAYNAGGYTDVDMEKLSLGSE